MDTLIEIFPGGDKGLHCFVCAVLILVLLYKFRWKKHRYLIAALITLALGMGKEFWDMLQPNNSWDWYDLLADVIGISGGLYLGSLIGKP